MNIKNIKVKHNIYGSGTIIDFNDNFLSVKFSGKTSRFVYPYAFEKFIQAEEPSIQEAILNYIAIEKRAEERRRAELVAHKAEEERKTSEKQLVSTIAKKDRINSNIEKGFKEDYHVAHLARKPILTYKEVEDQFKIKIAGFGRGINQTQSTVVLISSIDKKKSGFVYHDHWTIDGDYIYSGEGKTGDQTMSSGNRAILFSAEEGKSIHLFVKFSPKEYYYQGVFELVNYTYEEDTDENGNKRKEYKFRLRKVN